MAFMIMFATTFYSPKAEAAIGLIAKHKITKTIGGITAATGGTVALASYVSVATGLIAGWDVLAVVIVGFIGGGAVAGIGLIVLDDNTVADVNFAPINKNQFPELTQNQITNYNNDLELLNSIKETVSAELSENATYEESAALWKSYSYALSEGTLDVAGVVSRKFLKNQKSAL
jgi:hypothetical protein